MGYGNSDQSVILRSRAYIRFATCRTLTHSTSSLNGPAFLSLTMKPRALTPFGSTGPASSTGLPNEVASNVSSGTSISTHSPFFVCTVARYEKAISGLAR